jgi:hypothetical protein
MDERAASCLRSLPRGGPETPGEVDRGVKLTQRSQTTGQPAAISHMSQQIVLVFALRIIYRATT